ncbi:MAG: hypothetical protein EAX91_10780 [Candidatus Lokiarchaeota archaeon]|nr:hypothetical protein [Candidatus Lokiarchaeota archaeon]
MSIVKKEISSDFNEFPNQEFLEESKDNLKKEMSLVTPLEPTLDPVQKKRNEKTWKQSLGYYLLNPEKFSFGLKDFR